MASSKKPAAKKKKPQRTAAVKRERDTVQSLSSADLVDEQLSRYRSMRDFSITEEPSGTPKDSPNKATLPFCVQKHAASHLHYDFRLGWNGVLKSWAVAKGPSYYTGDKRLAVQVEDHPLEYGGFEGIIPKGQYGGGTVMLWDQGTWEPQTEYPDVDAGIRDGTLKFVLHGKKLKGKWALIRMKGRWEKESKPNWLLIKEHDSFERKESDAAVTETEQTSVVTGRSMEEIARNEDHVWNSKDTHSGEKAWKRTEPRTPRPTPHLRLDALPKERQPQFVNPALATRADFPPESSGWLHELKLDGYRIQARKSGDKVQLLTRTGLDWTTRMRSIAKEVARLPVESITMDGELVVLAENGTTSFADLQASMQEGAPKPLSYFAFDLLHVNGHNTRELELKNRKDLLAELLQSIESDSLRFSEHIETGGERLLREACKLRAEGIVSKRSSSTYGSGRTSDWVKTKCLHEQEFVVGGYTALSNGGQGIGALLLGYYRDGELIYAGRTGTGFTQKTHKTLRNSLDQLQTKKCHFEKVPAEAAKGAVWVLPELVVQVRFASWTADQLVRQSAYLGIREDKDPNDVVREEDTIGPRSSKARRQNSADDRKDLSAEATAPTETTPGRLTHPDKILDPESGLTKRMLADYYWAVADVLLRGIAARPVSLVRCPDGVGKPAFFQKHLNATLPESVSAVEVPDKKTGKIEKYITLSTPEALVALAQLSVLEIHPWGSQNGDLEHPDRLIFDLDPDEDLSWDKVVSAAVEVRALLKKHGLQSFVKTTGGKGLHVVAPIIPAQTWSELKMFAQRLVVSLEERSPSRYLTKMTKSARAGRIYLDYLRNAREATSVAAYSPRARKGVAVSMPLSWKELESSDQRPQFRVVGFADWRDRLRHDPWKDMETLQQKIKMQKD